MSVHARLILSLAAFSLALAQAGDRRVAFIRPPAFASTRAAIQVQVRIAPHPDNRQWTLAAVEGDIAVRTIQEPLNGEKSARTRWVTFLIPPCDPCLLIAAVYGIGDRPLARDVRPITVLDY